MNLLDGGRQTLLFSSWRDDFSDSTNQSADVGHVIAVLSLPTAPPPPGFPPAHNHQLSCQRATQPSRMKFGRHLRTSLVREYQYQYFDYDGMKKEVRDGKRSSRPICQQFLMNVDQEGHDGP